ncbi:MAG TPA: Qat anti-phage system QueC-like protein QatC [Candidatus Angelobacter sp.]|jgi:7-cyano-7-deazaguanine synthase in queuosine biosynthesis|nr:Qat anti-phage system QueC-like protein QatC [Candidatus Angelobacter sp.]
MIVNVQLTASRRSKRGFLIPRIHIPELKVRYDVHLGLKEFLPLGIPDLLGLDFAYLAGIVYTIDRAIPRGSSTDNWTRVISVEVPVAQPASWQHATTELEQALGFLSGDIWEITFRKTRLALFKKPAKKRKSFSKQVKPESFESVCLFSGGLDSLVGAVDMLHAGKRLILIGHHDSPGPQSQQDRLFKALLPIYGTQAHWIHARVGPSPRRAPEKTLRTRSLVFMALGVLAARAIGKNSPVFAPENGFIGINTPLTPSRVGSCSTRTMHPFFLNSLTAALVHVGIVNKVTNPLELKTKGECITQCLNQSVLAETYRNAVSCSHASRRQDWKRKDAKNCGYCVPCLIRRAALHKAGWDDGDEYGIDVCKGELTPDARLRSAEDLRAVLDFLGKKYSNVQIRQLVVSVAHIPTLSEHTQVVQRGVAELREWVASTGTSEMRNAGGILN